MFFTLEDLKRIEDWLVKRSKKDTDFEKASPLKGEEELAIIQDGKNKRLSIRELVGQLSGESGDIDKGVLYDSIHSVGVNFGFADEVRIWSEKNNGEVNSESIPAASQYAAGVMSKEDKVKLDESVAMATPLTGNDGSCILEIERNNGTYIEFPFPKAGEGNDGMMSKDDKKKLDSIIPSGLTVSNNGGPALNICDTNGNIIVRFSGGHIRTKFFDSRNYSTDTTPDDMSIKGTSIIVKDADFTGFDIGEGPVIPPVVPPEVLEQFAYNFPFTVGG